MKNMLKYVFVHKLELVQNTYEPLVYKKVWVRLKPPSMPLTNPGYTPKALPSLKTIFLYPK